MDYIDSVINSINKPKPFSYEIGDDNDTNVINNSENYISDHEEEINKNNLVDSMNEIFVNNFKKKEDNYYNEEEYNEKLYLINTDPTNNKTDKSNKNNNTKKNCDNSRNRQIIKKQKNKKIKRELGRRRKKDSYNDKSIHNKYDIDNMRIKIFNRFRNSALIYVNKLYQQFELKNKMKKRARKLLKKLKYKRTIIKSEGKIIMSEKLWELLGEETSKRCHCVPDYNIKNIETLFKKGEAIETINFLNNTVEQVYNMYYNDDKKIVGFNYLEDLPELIKDDEDQSYKEKLLETMKGLVKYFI